MGHDCKQLNPVHLLRATQYANVVKLKSILTTMESKDFLECRDENGRSALHWVCDAGIPEDGWECYQEIIVWLKRMIRLKSITTDDFGEYLNQQDKKGETALHIAIKNSCRQIADDLILKGADVTVKSLEEQSQMDLLGIYCSRSLVNDMNKNVNYIKKSRYCAKCSSKAPLNDSNEVPLDNLLQDYTFCLHLGTFIPYYGRESLRKKEGTLGFKISRLISGNYPEGQDVEMDCGETKMERGPRGKLNRMTIQSSFESKEEDFCGKQSHSEKPKKPDHRQQRVTDSSLQQTDNQTVKPRNEMEMIYRYNEAKQNLRDAVLVHPLLTAFLHLKWGMLQNYILFTMIYYLLWVIQYFGITVAIFCFRFPTRESKLTTGVENMTLNIANTTSHFRIVHSSDNEGALEILKAMRLLSTLFPLFVEFVQLIGLRFSYFTDAKNFAQIFLIFLAISEYTMHVPRMVNAFAILCCIFLLLSQVDEFPNIISESYKIPVFMKSFLTWVNIRYFEIFRNLMKKIAWLLIPFGLVLLGFQLAFSIIFRQIKEFDITFTSFVRMLALSIGHVGYSDVFTAGYRASAKPYHEDMAHAVYAIFLIIVVFVWTNFLIGITLEDFQKERLNAEMNSISCRIEMMYVMEKLIHSIPTFLPFINKKDWYEKTSVLHKYGKGLELRVVHVHKSIFPRELVQQLRDVINAKKSSIRDENASSTSENMDPKDKSPNQPTSQNND